jgi:outer membrane protein assembly factor BamB
VCSSVARLLDRAAPIIVTGALLAACGGERPSEPPPKAVPVRLVVCAPDTAVAIGGTLQFTAVAFDSAGAVVATEPVTWSVTYALPGRITADGVFTGRGAGVTWVRAGLAAPPLADSLRVHVLTPGTVKWTWPAGAAGGNLPWLGGPALGADGTVYVLVEHGAWPDWLATLVALSPDGTVRWTRELQQISFDYPVVTPAGDILVVGGHVELFGPDGALRWGIVTDAFTPARSSAVATDELAIAAYGHRVAAFRLATGDTVWQSAFAPLSDWLVPPTAVGPSVVYAKHTEDTLFVFRQSDGAILRTFLDPDTGVDKRVLGRGTVPLGDRFYLPTWNRLAAFDTAGPLLWLTDATALGMSEPAVGSDGVLYVQNGNWGLQAINPDGTTKWYRRHLLPDGNAWSEQPRWRRSYGGAALAQGGIIYAAGQGAFYAYDAAGTLLWSFTADSAGTWRPFIGSPAVAPDGTVYTFTSTHLYAFWGPAPPEPNSPWPMWRHDAQRTGWAR